MTVEPDLTLPGHPEVFALGDMIRVRGRDGSPITLPGLAPVAMQEGRYAAEGVRARLPGRAAPPFRSRAHGTRALALERQLTETGTFIAPSGPGPVSSRKKM